MPIVSYYVHLYGAVWWFALLKTGRMKGGVDERGSGERGSIKRKERLVRGGRGVGGSVKTRGCGGMGEVLGERR